MDRRKFLIGAGSTAVGASALIGSGAFTSVNANRDVTVELADDANALLRMEIDEDDPNSEYATTEDGPNDQTIIEIDISGDNPTGAGGEGVNDDATTNILEIFVLENQGTQEVEVSATGIGHDIGSGSSFPGVDLVAFPIPGGGSSSLSDNTAQPVLAPGETLGVGLWIDTTSSGFQESYNATIHAEATGS